MADNEITDAPAPAAPVIADEIAAAVVEKFPAAIFNDSHGQSVLYVERSDWHAIAEFLRNEQRFTQCMDVTAVDHLVDETRLVIAGVTPERFEVVANFLSHPRNRRLRIIAQVPETDTEIASLTDLYPGTNFPEREIFDLFGITFLSHPDLTRILLPDEWVGYPLRKDDAIARIPVTFKGDPGPQ
jgi:NADH-quinone oxidoreductase subunit C